MSTHRSAFLAFVLTIGLAAPAAAQSIPIAIPDITSGFAPITFTNWSGMGVWQQVTNGWTQLTNEARNLGSFGTLAQQSITNEIKAMTSPPTSTAPNSAAVAAQAIATQAPLSAATISQIDADAKAADGAQQQEQVNNMYQSRIAGGIEKANTLAAQQELQKQSQDQQTSTGLGTIFSGAINPAYQL
jgi:hypothetical protein